MDIISVLLVLSCLFLLGSSRLQVAVRVVAVQGVLLGILPLVRSMGDITAGIWILGISQILETRFANVIRRLHWARTIWQARQMVSHGHFLINSHKVDFPAYEVKAGDLITVKPGSEEFVRAAVEYSADVASVIPEWLNVDNDNLKALVVRLPQPGEIRLPFEIDLPRVVEMYTR